MDRRFDALSGRHVPPDESTLRDALSRIDAAALGQEIPELALLLADTGLAGVILTVDALHTRRGTARTIAEDHRRFHLMTAKDILGVGERTA